MLAKTANLACDMALMMIGASHHDTSMQILERLSVRISDQPFVLKSLVAGHHINEALLLSTCNRKELYVDTVSSLGGQHDVVSFFTKYTGLDRETLQETFVVKNETEAARHLFRVASGLESMVVGERQILMQIRQSFAQSLDEQTSGPMLNKVFRQAINLGRTIRQKTELGEGTASTVSVALQHAVPKLPPNPTILVIGAGHIGGMVARTLVGIEGDPSLNAHPKKVVICNRTIEKAEELAARIEEANVTGMAIPLTIESIARSLVDIDLVVSTTDATHPLITKDILEIVLPHKHRSDLVLVDMAVPRDIEKSVSELPNVTHIDIEALRDLVVDGPTQQAIITAEKEIEKRTKEFSAWLQGVSVEPTIKALHYHGESIRQSEFQRLQKKLASLTDEQRNSVEALTKGIVNTLLHKPTIMLKQHGSTDAGKRYAQSMSVLFDLEVIEEDTD